MSLRSPPPLGGSLANLAPGVCHRPLGPTGQLPACSTPGKSRGLPGRACFLPCEPWTGCGPRNAPNQRGDNLYPDMTRHPAHPVRASQRQTGPACASQPRLRCPQEFVISAISDEVSTAHSPHHLDASLAPSMHPEGTKRPPVGHPSSPSSGRPGGPRGVGTLPSPAQPSCRRPLAACQPPRQHALA